LVAPDGITSTRAAPTSRQFVSGWQFLRYLGIGADAAGVAAADPGRISRIQASQLIESLKAGAAQLGAPRPMEHSDMGRIDAMGTLGTFPVPTITSLPDSSLNAGSSSPSYPFTVSGTGALHFSVTSSNATSIPASIVAAGSPGVTIAPRMRRVHPDMHSFRDAGHGPGARSL